MDRAKKITNFQKNLECSKISQIYLPWTPSEPILSKIIFRKKMLLNSILIFIYLKLYVSQSWAKSEILIFRFKIFHNNCAHLFPKGEFLITHHCWVPLFRMLSFSCFIVLKFFTPTFRGLYLVGGGGGWWWWWWWTEAYFGSNFDFFQSCLEAVLKLSKPQPNLNLT